MNLCNMPVNIFNQYSSVEYLGGYNDIRYYQVIKNEKKLYVRYDSSLINEDINKAVREIDNISEELEKCLKNKSYCLNELYPNGYSKQFLKFQKKILHLGDRKLSKKHSFIINNYAFITSYDNQSLKTIEVYHYGKKIFEKSEPLIWIENVLENNGKIYFEVGGENTEIFEISDSQVKSLFFLPDTGYVPNQDIDCNDNCGVYYLNTETTSYFYDINSEKYSYDRLKKYAFKNGLLGIKDGKYYLLDNNFEEVKDEYSKEDNMNHQKTLIKVK